MRTPCILSLLTIAVVLWPSTVQGQGYPLAEDVASPEAIVAATYEAIQRAPGETFQWDRFRSLFLPQALMIPSTEQMGGAFRVLSVEDFIALVDSVTIVGGSDDKGFAEEVVHNTIERFGDIAHVFSTYQKRFWTEEEILGRGINTFQLVYNQDRWWVSSIAWDEEIGAGPIPAKYLP